MGNFFVELKRRHIYRVAAAYAVVAWIVLQVVNNVTQPLNLPSWTAALVVVLLFAGFPIALVFAWTVELNAAPVGSDGTTARLSEESRTKQQRVGFGGGEPDRSHSGARSIAVLPFANISEDPGQEFFSDGMTEEITAALANVADLRVVARTSAFEFKGQNHNIRAIGEALGASHLIEGSVRKAGNRVRITAQLIKAQDGTHLWAQKFDRDLTDAFSIQEEIAQAIAEALKVPLGLKQGETLVRNRTGDFASYQHYLRSRALVRGRGASISEAIGILEPLVARDPGFAPAWALLAHAYFLLPSYDSAARTASLDAARRFVESCYNKAEVAARRAIKLDSKNAAGSVALAAIHLQRGKWIEAEDLFRQALAIDPVEPEALYNLGVTLACTGRLKEAVAVGQMLNTLEPFVPNYNITVAGHMLSNGQVESAIIILESIPAAAGGGYYRSITLAQAYAAQGRFREAADALLAMPQPNVVGRRSVEDAAQLIRSASANETAPKDLPILEGGLNFVYGYIGAHDLIMDFPERVRDITGGGTITFIWSPAYAGARSTERFKSYIRAIGLFDYWYERGWPERCRPIGADDFICN